MEYVRHKKKAFPIDLKHYAIKSKEEYQKKISGTDVTFKKNPHTENAFLFHDIRSTRENDEMMKYVGNGVEDAKI